MDSPQCGFWSASTVCSWVEDWINGCTWRALDTQRCSVLYGIIELLSTITLWYSAQRSIDQYVCVCVGERAGMVSIEAALSLVVKRYHGPKFTSDATADVSKRCPLLSWWKLIQNNVIKQKKLSGQLCVQDDGRDVTRGRLHQLRLSTFAPFCC